MDWIGWTCWGVIGLSSLVVLWALFWDRSKGRIRCRRCAYDMEGVGLICPECGREHSSERALTKTKRKWKTVIVGSVAICTVLLIHVQRFSIYHEGISGLVPTYFLARFANVQSVEAGTASKQSWIDTKFSNRLSDSNASRASCRVWASRLKEYLSELEVGGIVVESYDLSSVSGGILNYDLNWRAYYDKNQASFVRNRNRNWNAQFVTEFIIQRIWSENQGSKRMSGYAYKLVGDQVVLSATREEHQMFRHMLSQIKSRYWSAEETPSFSVGSHRSFIRYDISWLFFDENSFSPELFYDILLHIEIRILPIPLEPGYGDPAAFIPLTGELVVWADGAYHNEIMEYLGAVELEYSTPE